MEFCGYIHPKKNLFLFDGLGIEGFKFFIVTNNQKIIDELLYNFKKCDSKSNQKIKLCAMNVCVETWQKMSHKVKEQLPDTTQIIFHLLEQFTKLKKTECMNILILVNNVESITGQAVVNFNYIFIKICSIQMKKIKL